MKYVLKHQDLEMAGLQLNNTMSNFYPTSSGWKF